MLDKILRNPWKSIIVIAIVTFILASILEDYAIIGAMCGLSIGFLYYWVIKPNKERQSKN